MEGNLQAAGPAVNGARHENFVDNLLEVIVAHLVNIPLEAV